MKKVKLGLALGIFILLFSTLVGCADKGVLKNIYNDNDKIAAQGDSYSFSNRVGNTNDEKIEVEYKRFYGAETIATIKAEKPGKIEMDYTSEIDQGTFKAVFIDPADQEVITMFENGKESESQQGTYTINAAAGVYRIKIVGDNASGSFKLQFKLDEGMKLVKP